MNPIENPSILEQPSSLVAMTPEMSELKTLQERMHKVFQLSKEIERDHVFIQERNQSPSTSSVPTYTTLGGGPTFLEKVYSGLTSFLKFMVGQNIPYEPSPDRTLHPAQERVANRGNQLKGSDVFYFLEGLSHTQSLNVIHHFYLLKNSGINLLTLEEIKMILNNQSTSFIPQCPIIIPVTFESDSFWERNHIAVIFIHNNIVEYYDSRGVTSPNRSLKNSDETLRSVLEYCSDVYTNKGLIVENPHMHQFDSHNCGVFICRWLHSRITNSIPPGSLDAEVPPISTIDSFREEINTIAYSHKEDLSDDFTFQVWSDED